MHTKSKKKISRVKKEVDKSAVKEEVGRILKNNMKPMELEESHIPFVYRFLKNIISEQEEVKPKSEEIEVSDVVQKGPEEFTPETNKQDFEQSLELNTEPDTFDTEGASPDITSDTINSIKEWSTKLDQFAQFLNDPTEESLHKILADGDRAGSLLRGITRKASDSITRIAGEIEKLKEILNTYIITAPKKLRDTEQQTSGWTQY